MEQLSEEELDALAYIEAGKDIAAANEFLDRLTLGVKTLPVFQQPGLRHENKVATLVRLIHEGADFGGALLLAALAIIRLGECVHEQSS